jgi:hypothetical protein
MTDHGGGGAIANDDDEDDEMMKSVKAQMAKGKHGKNSRAEDEKEALEKKEKEKEKQENDKKTGASKFTSALDLAYANVREYADDPRICIQRTIYTRNYFLFVVTFPSVW